MHVLLTQHLFLHSAHSVCLCMQLSRAHVHIRNAHLVHISDQQHVFVILHIEHVYRKNTAKALAPDRSPEGHQWLKIPIQCSVEAFHLPRVWQFVSFTLQWQQKCLKMAFYVWWKNMCKQWQWRRMEPGKQWHSDNITECMQAGCFSHNIIIFNKP